MKLTILGSGTMMPTKERYPVAYLVEHSEHKLLLDCSHMAMARLIEHGGPELVQALDAILITHFHTDHFWGLPSLIHNRWIDDVVANRNHPELTLIGPDTLNDRLAAARKISWPEPDESYPHNVKEGTLTEMIGDITVNSFPINHVEWFPSVGFRLDAGGSSLVYTGDLNDNQGEEFFNALADVDVLLIEACAPNAGHGTHLSVQQAIDWAKQHQVKKVVLTHLRQSAIEAMAEVTQADPDLVVIAHDGLVIDL